MLGPDGVTVHVPLATTDAPGVIVNVIVIDPPVSLVGVNPAPKTTATVPLVPLLGVSVIAGVVTVNVAFATTVLVEGSDTTTWPLAVDGTAIVVPEGMLVPEPVVKESVEPHAVGVVVVASKQ